ncbi:MAG: hypothetical protein KKH77_02895 [Candidatus Omnitrophica bacterium]|nr:hypothetical protein [Candidatus Omnitrophota bacterium]MBU0881056.1 hypothetical protein [Candidatus Omnitrophota bacterium]MBU0895339.1 hypothetical protein [Candidatus Omnitrophota bacterium]MBU1807978.1 hypothetical protein [Candidatus Omnitrophota bacterium]
MVEINLLPQELKPKPSLFSGINFKGLDINSIPILKIAMGIGACLVLAQLAISLIWIVSNAELKSSTKKYNEILPEKTVADALKTKVAYINKRSGAIDELIVKRFSWARKMSLLSDCVTPGIWFSELYYDERPVTDKAKTGKPGALIISGYASGAGEQGTALIGKFIKSLQDNKEFYSDMASVDLVSTKSDKVDKQDVMSFRVTCIYK